MASGYVTILMIPIAVNLTTINKTLSVVVSTLHF